MQVVLLLYPNFSNIDVKCFFFLEKNLLQLVFVGYSWFKAEPSVLQFLTIASSFFKLNVKIYYIRTIIRLGCQNRNNTDDMYVVLVPT